MQEFIQEKPNLNFEHMITALKSLIIIFYGFIILFPYISSAFKGKNGCDEIMENPTLSNAFKNCNKPGEVLIIFNFVFFVMWLFAYRGVFFNLDGRLIFPIMIWVFTVGMFLLLWITPHYKYNHLAVTFFIVLSGQSLAIIGERIYSDKYKESQDYKNLRNFAYSALCIVGILGLTLILVPGSFGKKNHIICLLEIIHATLIGGALYSYLSLPALPSGGVLQLPLSQREVNQEIKNMDN